MMFNISINNSAISTEANKSTSRPLGRGVIPLQHYTANLSPDFFPDQINFGPLFVASSLCDIKCGKGYT